MILNFPCHDLVWRRAYLLNWYLCCWYIRCRLIAPILLWHGVNLFELAPLNITDGQRCKKFHDVFDDISTWSQLTYFSNSSDATEKAHMMCPIAYISAIKAKWIWLLYRVLKSARWKQRQDYVARSTAVKRNANYGNWTVRNLLLRSWNKK